ncbi:hypothetical protein D3C75_1098690 [compost metagenome]
MLDNSPNAQRGDGKEPQRHNRPENFADARGAQGLNGEQADQDHHRRRQDIGLRLGQDNIQPFQRRQYRNRRGDRAIAVDQRRAKQAGKHHHRSDLFLTDQQ